MSLKTVHGETGGGAERGGEQRDGAGGGGERNGVQREGKAERSGWGGVKVDFATWISSCNSSCASVRLLAFFQLFFNVFIRINKRNHLSRLRAVSISLVQARYVKS